MHAPSRAPLLLPLLLFTQSPFPPRSLVRDGQTSPHKPLLVESHSTCPPLFPSPHASSFEIGPAVIINNFSNAETKRCYFLTPVLVEVHGPGDSLVRQDGGT